MTNPVTSFIHTLRYHTCSHFLVTTINLPKAQHQHMAGATYLVSKESLDAGKYKWEEVIGPPAVSTTTREIFESIEADTVVIKIDVEGHECKALLPEILDQSTGKFVPYIFMEVR